MHWETGSTDSVQGYDGSPVSNTDGKNICKINGIEIMPGGSFGIWKLCSYYSRQILMEIQAVHIIDVMMPDC